MVFLHHDPIPLFPTLQRNTLWTGVDLFFVLSGFLITGILYDSLESPHYFRSFYIRRTLRIFPIYYIFFGTFLIFAAVLSIHYDVRMLSFLLYLGNYAVPLLGSSAHNPTTLWRVHHGVSHEVANIGHLWSLCVEEQFYLVWPAVLWLVRKRRLVMQLCVLVIALEPLLRFTLLYLYPAAVERYLIFWGTLTRCDALLLGGWLALWLRETPLTRLQLKRIGSALAVGFGCAFAICLAYHSLVRSGAFANLLRNKPLTSVGLSFSCFAAAGVILLALDEASLVGRLLQWKPLQALGIVSYGFYFFHQWFTALFEQLAARGPQWASAVPFLHFGFTLLLALFSFRFIESPFLKLKDRWAPQVGSRSYSPSPLPSLVDLEVDVTPRRKAA